MLHDYDSPWLKSRQVTELCTPYLQRNFLNLADFGSPMKILARVLLFCLKLWYHTEFISSSLVFRIVDTLFLRRMFYDLMKECSRQLYPSSTMIVHSGQDNSSNVLFTSCSFSYWVNIVITVFVICLMAGRNRLVSRIALHTVAAQIFFPASARD